MLSMAQLARKRLLADLSISVAARQAAPRPASPAPLQPVSGSLFSDPYPQRSSAPCPRPDAIDAAFGSDAADAADDAGWSGLLCPSVASASVASASVASTSLVSALGASDLSSSLPLTRLSGLSGLCLSPCLYRGSNASGYTQVRCQATADTACHMAEGPFCRWPSQLQLRSEREQCSAAAEAPVPAAEVAAAAEARMPSEEPDSGMWLAVSLRQLAERGVAVSVGGGDCRTGTALEAPLSSATAPATAPATEAEAQGVAAGSCDPGGQGMPHGGSSATPVTTAETLVKTSHLAATFHEPSLGPHPASEQEAAYGAAEAATAPADMQYDSGAPAAPAVTVVRRPAAPASADTGAAAERRLTPPQALRDALCITEPLPYDGVGGGVGGAGLGVMRRRRECCTGYAEPGLRSSGAVAGGGAAIAASGGFAAAFFPGLTAPFSAPIAAAAADPLLGAPPFCAESYGLDSCDTLGAGSDADGGDSCTRRGSDADVCIVCTDDLDDVSGGGGGLLDTAAGAAGWLEPSGWSSIDARVCAGVEPPRCGDGRARACQYGYYADGGTVVAAAAAAGSAAHQYGYSLRALGVYSMAPAGLAGGCGGVDGEGRSGGAALQAAAALAAARRAAAASMAADGAAFAGDSRPSGSRASHLPPAIVTVSTAAGGGGGRVTPAGVMLDMPYGWEGVVEEVVERALAPPPQPLPPRLPSPTASAVVAAAPPAARAGGSRGGKKAAAPARWLCGLWPMSPRGRSGRGGDRFDDEDW